MHVRLVPLTDAVSKTSSDIEISSGTNISSLGLLSFGTVAWGFGESIVSILPSFVSNFECLKQNWAQSGMCELNFLETDKTVGAGTGRQVGDLTPSENVWSGLHCLRGFQPIPKSNLWKAHNCWSWKSSLPSLFSISAFLLHILLSSNGLNSYKQEVNV